MAEVVSDILKQSCQVWLNLLRAYTLPYDVIVVIPGYFYHEV